MLCCKHSVGGVLGQHCWEHNAWKMLVVTKDVTASPLSRHWCISRRTAATSPTSTLVSFAACARRNFLAATWRKPMLCCRKKSGRSFKTQQKTRIKEYSVSVSPMANCSWLNTLGHLEVFPKVGGVVKLHRLGRMGFQ